MSFTKLALAASVNCKQLYLTMGSVVQSQHINVYHRRIISQTYFLIHVYFLRNKLKQQMSVARY